MYEQFESYAGVPKDQRQTLWININQGRIAFRTLLDNVEDSQVERRSLTIAKQTIQEHSTHFLYTSARGEYATPNSVSHADSQIILARDCFNEITRLNLPLVGAIVKRHPSLQAVGSSVGLTNLDLLGYGQVGLVQSADRYDHRTGVDFGAFAHRRIQGAITDALRKITPYSRDDVSMIQDLDSTIQGFWVRDGRAPSVDELSVLMGLDIDSMKDIVRLANTSLVSLPREGDEGTEEFSL